MGAPAQQSNGRKSLGAIRLRSPTVAVAVALILAVLVSAELLARTELARRWMVTPSVGTTHHSFEIKLEMIEEFARRGPIDCLMIGNSMVAQGINPAAVEQVYRERTGRSLRCFNFGVDSATAPTTIDLARILVAKFRPKLLVIGTSPYDFEPGARPRTIAHSPWLRYRKGETNFRGWLTEHSAAYRYLLTHRQWIRPDYWKQMNTLQRRRMYMRQDGFRPMPNRKKGGNFPQCRMDNRPNERARRAMAALADFTRDGIEVLTVEMPFVIGRNPCFKHRPARYRALAHMIAKQATAHRIPHLRSYPFDAIPDIGWWDPGHLNQVGAEHLSRWLGEQLAASHPDGIVGPVDVAQASE